MEMESYAKKGVAGTALGLSIGSLGWQALNNGVLGNVLGGNRCCDNHGSDAAVLAAVTGMMNMASSIVRGSGECSEDHCVNRYEAGQAARIAELETEVKLRDANTYTDGKLLDLYKYVDGKFACIEGQIGQQAVYNATNTATINCISGQVAQLMALTKLVIPNGSICPGWGNVTVTPAAAPTTGA